MKPALTPLAGSAIPRPVGRLSALLAVQYHERACDDATDALLAAAPADLPAARVRLFAAHDRLLAAEARRNRVQAEERNEPWLRCCRG